LGLSRTCPRLVNRRTSAQIRRRGPDRADDVTRSGDGRCGARKRRPLSLHYRGGLPKCIGLLWEKINGTDGVIQVTAAKGHAQMVRLSLSRARGSQQDLRPIPVPAFLPRKAAGRRPRAQRRRHVPPAFISTGALDLFVDEDIDYARRLNRAGVSVELHVYPGAFHGFTLMPDAVVASAARRDSFEALRRFASPFSH